MEAGWFYSRIWLSFSNLQQIVPQVDERARGAGEAALAALHVEHEDHQLDGPKRDDEGDPQGARRQQLRLRAAREVPAPVRPRRPQHGQPGAVGDGGLQAAAALPQWRPF